MLKFRKAKQEDLTLLFDWANDPFARNNSYNQQKITIQEHTEWFTKQIKDTNNSIYVFLDEHNANVGLVRFGMNLKGQAIISLFIAEAHRGKGYARQMIDLSVKDFLSVRDSGMEVLAYIFKTNEISFRSFLKAGFKLTKEEDFKNIPSYILTRKNT